MTDQSEYPSQPWETPPSRTNRKMRAVTAALVIPLATVVVVSIVGGTIGSLTTVPEKKATHVATTTTTVAPTTTTEDALRGACEAAAHSGAQKELIEECLASGRITPDQVNPNPTCPPGRVLDRTGCVLPPPTTPAPPPPPPTVTYDLTGQGTVSVTLQNASGGTEQFETPLPYHLDLGPAGTFGGLSGFVYISAQLQDTGTVTCMIKKGDQVIQTATSSGQYVIASCSGSV